jgi:hypothetical protein
VDNNQYPVPSNNHSTLPNFLLFCFPATLLFCFFATSYQLRTTCFPALLLP